jgi:hypothetical protein
VLPSARADLGLVLLAAPREAVDLWGRIGLVFPALLQLFFAEHVLFSSLLVPVSKRSRCCFFVNLLGGGIIVQKDLRGAVSDSEN